MSLRAGIKLLASRDTASTLLFHFLPKQSDTPFYLHDRVIPESDWMCTLFFYYIDHLSLHPRAVELHFRAYQMWGTTFLSGSAPAYLKIMFTVPCLEQDLNQGLWVSVYLNLTHMLNHSATTAGFQFKSKTVNIFTFGVCMDGKNWF